MRKLFRWPSVQLVGGVALLLTGTDATLLHRSRASNEAIGGAAVVTSDKEAAEIAVSVRAVSALLADDSQLPPEAIEAGKRTVASADLQKQLAQAAADEAKNTGQALLANQQNVVADMARDAAETEFEKQRPAIPVAKAALNEARVFAFQAQKSADHAALMAAAIKRVPEEAAQNAIRSIEDTIVKAGYQAAEAAASAPPESEEERQKRIKAAVDAYAWPFHKAYLDAYELMKNTFMMSKSAAKQVDPMRLEAGALSSEALKMQVAGQQLQSQMMMQKANQVMLKAVKLRSWAEILYGQANDINGKLGAFQAREGAARAKAFGELSMPVTVGRPLPEMGVLGLSMPAA